MTKNGRPFAVLASIDEEELLEQVLANAPEYVHSMRSTQGEISRGARGRLLDEFEAGTQPSRSPGEASATFDACRQTSERRSLTRSSAGAR